MAAKNDPTVLKDVEAFLFDVFGTVVDWQGSVSKQLAQYYEGLLESLCFLYLRAYAFADSDLMLRLLACSRLDPIYERMEGRIYGFHVSTLVLIR